MVNVDSCSKNMEQLGMIITLLTEPSDLLGMPKKTTPSQDAGREEWHRSGPGVVGAAGARELPGATGRGTEHERELQLVSVGGFKDLRFFLEDR